MSRKIIALRDIRICNYGAIDDGKTWHIVTTCPHCAGNFGAMLA